MKLNLQYFADQTQQNPTEGIQQDPSGGTQQTVEEKRFSQEEVNRIIGERLAKEKAKAETDIARREQELAEKEFQFRAKEILSERKMPMELLEALNCKDETSLKKGIDIVEKYVKSKEPVIEHRIEGAGFTKGYGNHSPESSIRNAMGLYR